MPCVGMLRWRRERLCGCLGGCRICSESLQGSNVMSCGLDALERREGARVLCLRGAVGLRQGDGVRNGAR